MLPFHFLKNDEIDKKILIKKEREKKKSASEKISNKKSNKMFKKIK